MTLAAKKVWRQYDQAALDIQYNSRATVPDVGVYLKAYADATRSAQAGLSCQRDVPYGPGASERLDVYPATGPDAPVLVYLHGGDWRALSKADSGFAAPAFVNAGVTFIALDFSLVPQVGLLEMGEQVRRAVAWIWRNAAAFGGDPGRLHVAGHSSGANLVGQLLMTDWAGRFGLPADTIKSAVFASGLGDLEPVRLSFRNANLHLTPEVVHKASLLRQEPRACCPLMVLVGADETDDYRSQSREVVTHWAAAGNRATLHELAGRHHFDAVLQWADPASACFHAHLDLIHAAGRPVDAGLQK
ncbi:MAG: alpha/beta hydrolase [Polaromonas sp.]|nr:alpha/beta hydrolase [Polaromonas sp.]